MLNRRVYMDNHATTCVDPRVVEAMLPYFSEIYGNAGSTSHSFGHAAKEAVDASRETIASAIGAQPREIVFTSGATESNNLALRGAVARSRQVTRHIVSVETEHRAVLDPLERLAREGCELTLLPVHAAPQADAGAITAEEVGQAIRPNTVLASVMLANNEIGVIQPIREIAAVCTQRGVLLHCDATQAVGKLPVDVDQLGVDLLSFSAHKIYGPKGVGALFVRSRPVVRLRSLIDGGGQERGLRSGTLNVPCIVGLAKAIQLCVAEMADESRRLAGLRNRLFAGLCAAIHDVSLNGPALDNAALRLAGNLNASFAYVDGEALMMSMKDLAVSSGSACTSANPEPSHVLRALGIGDDLTRASLRFGLGRFNTEEEIDFAIGCVAEAVDRLRKLSSLA